MLDEIEKRISIKGHIEEAILRDETYTLKNILKIGEENEKKVWV